jgi:hypothetical protein
MEPHSITKKKQGEERRELSFAVAFLGPISGFVLLLFGIQCGVRYC